MKPFKPENPHIKNNIDSWHEEDTKHLHGLGISSENAPIADQKIDAIVEEKRRQKIALEEMQETRKTIDRVNAELNDQATFENEIDKEFQKIQETSEQREARLHKEGKGQIIELPPEIKKVG